MSYFTESELEAFSDSPELLKKADSHNFSKASAAQVTIFLCHSHLDGKSAQGLINHLASFGIDLFVDWNDSDMPRITNRDTAERIKGRIFEMHLFLILATNNALNSRWVPWEIGVADQIKGADKILLIPVADASGRFQGNEYLQLYQTIEPVENTTGVFPPSQNKGTRIESFLKTAAAK